MNRMYSPTYLTRQKRVERMIEGKEREREGIIKKILVKINGHLNLSKKLRGAIVTDISALLICK